MTLLKERKHYLWLIIYTIFSLCLVGPWGFPAAAWIAPVFGIRYYRQCRKASTGFILLWLSTSFATYVSVQGMTIFYFYHPILEAAFLSLSSVILLIPFAIDRAYHKKAMARGNISMLLTFVYPISVLGIEYISYGESPLGTFGALAYSQGSFNTFIQLSSMTGLWGITFIFSWFSSIINYFWDYNFEFKKIKVQTLSILCVFLLIFGFGTWRLNSHDKDIPTVTIGGFSLPEDGVASMMELWNDHEDPVYRERLNTINQQQLVKIQEIIEKGAQIIVLQEVAIMGDEDAINAFMDNAKSIADRENVYLVLPYAQFNTLDKDHNALLIIDPEGEIVMEHHKYGGAMFEGSEPGDGRLKTIDTEYGRISAVICWDADFPSMITEAGRQNVDLLILPSNDWYEYKDIHAQMVLFRAVENGMSIFRQTGNGISLVSNMYGQVLNSVDMYEMSTEDDWTGVQIVDVPMKSVKTIYPLIGDIIGLTGALLFGVILVHLISLKVKRKRKSIKI